MEAGKNYDVFVDAEWKRMFKMSRELFRKIAVESGLPMPICAIAPPGTVQHLEAELFGDYPWIDRIKIGNILKGASDELISRVASALKPVDIEKYWNGGMPFNNLEWAKSQRKQLNKLIKQYGTHLKWLQKQLDKKSLPLPPAVKTEMQKSATALHDAIEIAKAYIRLFDTLNSRWKPDGTDYSQITRNPYWNSIITPVAKLIDEAKAQRTRTSAGTLEVNFVADKSRYRLLADLLHLAYPWAWKNDATTLKQLKQRV